MLLLVCALPHKDVVETHVGGEGEAAVGDQRVDEHADQLRIVLSHDVLEELVMLEVVDEGHLLVEGVVEDA